jgi:hypothetical protein
MNNKTKNIINFFDKNGVKNFIKREKYDSIFLDKIKKIFANNYKEDNYILLKNNEIIKKINDDTKEPILYKIFKELEYPNKNVLDYQYFLLWYRKNSTNLNLKNIISKSKKYSDVIYNPINSRVKLHRLFYDNSFVFLDILHSGEINDLNYEYFSNENTNIHLYTIRNSKPDVKIIMQIITFFRKMTQNNLDLELVIFYSNQKRLFPKNHDFFTPENINAGCTVWKKFIYIWRKEEFYKVLIHELIHYFSLDFHDKDEKYLENIRDSVFKIDGIDVVNEAYTEILAIIINSSFVSLIKNIDFSDIINYEILFTHFQIAKIINFFGGNIYEDIFNINIKQKTSVTSYIIVKGIFLNNLNIILEHFEKYFFGDKNKRFGDKNKRFEDYKKIYAKLVTKKKQTLNKELINKFLEIIKNNNINININKENFIFRTMRMTLFEI